MANLGQLISNSLWFAYDALDQHKSGALPKTQLKVLTQNIGVLLKIDRRVENCIEDYLSFQTLNYEQYLYFLTHEVLAEVDDGSTSYYLLQRYHDNLDRTFWLLARPNLLKRQQPIFTESALFKLFRIFCLLADRDSDKGSLSQVTLHKGEVEDVTRFLVSQLGREFDETDFEHLASLIPTFSLPVLVAFLEGRYLLDIEQPALEAAVEEIYQTYVGQVLEKGSIYQRTSFAPMWIPREVELVPWGIRARRFPRKEPSKLPSNLTFTPFLKLNKNSSFFSIQDIPGSKPCRFTIRSDEKLLHLAATDHRSKTRWLRSLEEAIENSEDPLPYQLLLCRLRKEERMLEEERILEENNRRASQADIIEKTQAELVAEKIARAEAEQAAREEATARAAEEKRVEELKVLQKELEELLKQETQAKRDEEIVRSLQARVLTEEWEKREELEKLQKEQAILLDEERRKREAFEKIQKEKEAQLNEAQAKLRHLELERMKLEREMQNTREKIIRSERGKEIVEARMKVKERKPPVRTYSLRPTRAEQRSTPLRSSSFNTHSNSRASYNSLSIKDSSANCRPNSASSRLYHAMSSTESSLLDVTKEEENSSIVMETVTIQESEHVKEDDSKSECLVGNQDKETNSKENGIGPVDSTILSTEIEISSIQEEISKPNSNYEAKT